MDDDDSAANRQYGNFENASWGFDALDSSQNQHADTDAEMLLDSVHDQDGGPFEDADSNAADQDSDRSFGDFHNTPNDWTDNDDYEDNHTYYSNTRTSDALHLEDTTMTSDNDPPAVEITLSENDDLHAKMD